MAVLCQMCGKEFSNKQNYTRHWRNFHEKVDDEDGGNKRFECSVCEKHFARKDNLKNHFARVHKKFYKKQCEVCGKCLDKQNYKRHMIQKHSPIMINIDKEQKFSCSSCDSKFKHLSNLNHHKKNVHQLGTIKSVNRTIKCPLCDFVTKICKRELMYLHFTNNHEISLVYETRQHKSLDEFYSWKHNIEKQTKTKYITVQTKSDVLTYKCHRSGKYKSTTVKRNLKTNGSCKINGFCPAFIKAKIVSDEVVVTHQQTHVGHTNELQHIRLTTEERKAIAIQLAKNVPFDEILKDIRDSLSNQPLERIHLTNRKDIHNIKKSFDLKAIAGEFSSSDDGCRLNTKTDEINVEVPVMNPVENSFDHEVELDNTINPNSKDTTIFDLSGVNEWIRHLNTSKNIALASYKLQGVVDFSFNGLKEEDFFLIYMTVAQKDFLLKNSKDIICIDSNCCCSLHLLSLIIPDETGEGFPVAFMFTNREDEVTLSIFFKQIKETVGSLIPKVLMSSIEEKYCASWKQVMERINLHLYSTWNLLKVWRITLSRLVKLKEKRNKIYKTLQSMLYELDEEKFSKVLVEALIKWNVDDIVEFSKYFYQTFVVENKFKKWAYCYRVNAGINTNISIENFYRVLKYINFKIDSIPNKTLCNILNLLRDKLFELVIKINKAKIAIKLQNLRLRHGDSYANDSEYVIQEGDKWHVLNNASDIVSEVYIVKKIKECNMCLLQCHQCNSCFHEYVCSCMDHLVKNNMCKHIHLVIRTQKMLENHHEDSTEISTLCGGRCMKMYNVNNSKEATALSKSCMEISEINHNKTICTVSETDYLVDISTISEAEDNEEVSTLFEVENCLKISTLSEVENCLEISETNKTDVTSRNLNKMCVQKIIDPKVLLEVRKKLFVEDVIKCLEEHVRTEEELEYVKSQCQPILLSLYTPKIA